MNNNLKLIRSQFVGFLILFYGTVFLLSLYLFAFIKGNYDVSDRLNYYYFFSDPSYNRFEPGFVFIGKFFKLINLSPEFSLTVLAFIIFIISILTISKFFKSKPFSSLFVFTIVFFAVTGIFSFAQLRAALALWLSLLFYAIYVKSGNKIALFMLTLTPLIHTLTILFVAVVFAYHVLKIRLFTIIILSSLLAILIISNYEIFFAFSGLDAYYVGYFSELKHDLSKSPFVLSYLFISIILILLKYKYNLDEYNIYLAGLPLTIMAYISSIDLLVKLSCPFIILTWILIFKIIIYSRLYQSYKSIVFLILFLLSLCSIYYSTIRYN
jgi:hypothetical protein